MQLTEKKSYMQLLVEAKKIRQWFILLATKYVYLSLQMQYPYYTIERTTC